MFGSVDHPSPNEINNLCGLDTLGFIGSGTRSWAVYSMGDNRALKIYRGRDYPISYVQEMDITSRLIHPGIVKTYKVTTRNTCIGININHGLIMEKVACSMGGSPTYMDGLKNTLIIAGALQLMAKNGLIHTDRHGGNQCVITKGGYKFVDLNGDHYSSYEDIRTDRQNYIDLYGFLISMNINNRGEFWNHIRTKGVTKKPITAINKYNLSNLENDLLYDLCARIYTLDNDILLSHEEIPTHPLFKLHGLTAIEGSMETRHIDFGNWPARNMDHHLIWRKVIPLTTDTDMLITSEALFIFESIDLYYRFLPFITNEDLETVAYNCVLLVLLAHNMEIILMDYYDRINDDITDLIVKSLNGHICDYNFYHLATTFQDFAYCWQLMFAPYDVYMKMNYKNFHSSVMPQLKNHTTYDEIFDTIVRPKNNPLMDSFDGNIVYDNRLIENMIAVPLELPKYIFSKLTSSELIEFLDVYSIDYSHDKNDYRFYLADLTERTYIYLYNQNKGNVQVTYAIRDLIISSMLNLKITHQYELSELQNMNNDDIRSFSSIIGLDPMSLNIKDSIIRILRMNYLIKV